MASYTMTVGGPDLYLEGLSWEVENPEPTLVLNALVRVDGRSPWSAEPAPSPNAAPGLFLFENGEPDGKPNPIRFQGSHFEFRFFVRYQGGAFDPSTFLANGWKRTPRLKTIAAFYQGESRVLTQWQSTR
jgi:hypothetical protein